MIHHAVAAALLLSQAAEGQRCITRGQAGDMAVTVLPIAVEAIARHCGPHVPATAFLNTGAAEMVGRLRAVAATRRQSALAGISAISGGNMPAGAPPEVAMAGISAMIGTALTANMRTESCADANTMVESLAPLPPENVANLVGAALGLATTNRPPADSDGEGESEAAPRGPLCPE